MSKENNMGWNTPDNIKDSDPAMPWNDEEDYDYELNERDWEDNYKDLDDDDPRIKGENNERVD